MKKNIRKIVMIICLIALTGSLAACGTSSGIEGSASASGSSGKTYEIIYAGTVSDTHPMSQTIKEAAEKMEEESDGRLVMKVFTNSQLGDSVSNFQQMQENAVVKMGEMSISAMSSFTDIYDCVSLPFLFKNKEQAFRFYDSDYQKKMEDQLAEECDVRPLAWFYNDSRTLTNNKREVRTPEDMKGLKIRIMQSDLYIKMFETMGAAPTSMSFAEVFTALQQKAIDGQDNGVTLTVTQKFYEAQKYYTDLGHVIDVAPILVSEEFYQSLPDDLKEILVKCMREAAESEREMVVEQADTNLKEIAKTCKITKLTDEERAAFREKCEPVYDWFQKEYPDTDLDELQEVIDNL